jgi:CheY-like chemotaxis protein/rubrerythrin
MGGACHNITMHISKFLDYCEQLENKQASMYEKLSRSFSSDGNTAAFFNSMSMDEPSHLEVVQKLQKMAARDPQLFSGVSVDIDQLKRILARSNYVSTAKLSLAEVMNQCCWIERNVAELYVIMALQQSNRKTAEFLIGVSKSFRRHYTSLLDYIEKRNIAIALVDSEQRGQLRIPYNENIMANETMMFRAVDISEEGIFLITGRFLQPGSILRLELRINNRRLNVNATVKFSKKGIGAGLKFVDLDPEQRTLIKDYIDTVTSSSSINDLAKKKILFIRNVQYPSSIMHMYISSLIEGGFSVLDVEDVSEAVHLLGERHQARFIILAVASVDDPNYNLLSYIKEFREYKAVPMMVISLNSSPVFEKMILDAGADRFLTKLSTPPNKLLEILQSYL